MALAPMAFASMALALMPDRTFLDWPFFDERHRALAREIDTWAAAHVPPLVAAHESPDGSHDGHDTEALARALVRALGDAGWCRHAVPAAYGGASDAVDVRSLCLVRETLARHDGLADFMFAMQGLGTGPISLFGTDEQKRRWLPRVARGEAIAAFAISEAEAGSDVGAMRTLVHDDGDAWVLDGEKTWISNAGIADQYVVFARHDDAEGKFAAYVVEADNPGLSVPRRMEVIAPHVLGTVRLERCRVPKDALLAAPRQGLRVALGTLDMFRSTVGAAALGFARRALDEAVAHVVSRQAFGRALSEHQLVQEKLADMAVTIDASALLVYRAAWTRDRGAARITREAAMAKLHATDGAQRVIDDAVQLLGARGVVRGEVVERLYREIRALRIYEGTSEIQKLVIAGQVVASATPTPNASA